MVGLTPTKRRIVYAEESGRCIYCGRPVSQMNYSVDHIIPRASGGDDSIDNLVCCCKTCNNKKDCRSLIDFIDDKSTKKKLKYYRRIDELRNANIISEEKAYRLLGQISIEPSYYKGQIRIGRLMIFGQLLFIKKGEGLLRKAATILK